jgi:hypothetical protein
LIRIRLEASKHASSSPRLADTTLRDPMVFNLQRFTVHADTIIAQLAHSIPLSDSCRTLFSLKLKNDTSCHVNMKTRDIEDFRG